MPQPPMPTKCTCLPRKSIGWRVMRRTPPFGLAFSWASVAGRGVVTVIALRAMRVVPSSWLQGRRAGLSRGIACETFDYRREGRFGATPFCTFLADFLGRAGRGFGECGFGECGFGEFVNESKGSSGKSAVSGAAACSVRAARIPSTQKRRQMASVAQSPPRALHARRP